MRAPQDELALSRRFRSAPAIYAKSSGQANSIFIKRARWPSTSSLSSFAVAYETPSEPVSGLYRMLSVVQLFREKQAAVGDDVRSLGSPAPISSPDLDVSSGLFRVQSGVGFKR